MTGSPEASDVNPKGKDTPEAPREPARRAVCAVRGWLFRSAAVRGWGGSGGWEWRSSRTRTNRAVLVLVLVDPGIGVIRRVGSSAKRGVPPRDPRAMLDWSVGWAIESRVK